MKKLFLRKDRGLDFHEGAEDEREQSQDRAGDEQGRIGKMVDEIQADKGAEGRRQNEVQGKIAQALSAPGHGDQAGRDGEQGIVVHTERYAVQPAKDEEGHDGHRDQVGQPDDKEEDAADENDFAAADLLCIAAREQAAARAADHKDPCDQARNALIDLIGRHGVHRKSRHRDIKHHGRKQPGNRRYDIILRP